MLLDPRLFNSCNDPITCGIAVFCDGTVFYVNQRMADILSYDAREIERMPLNQIVLDDSLLNSFTSKNSYAGQEALLISKTGRHIPCCLLSVPVPEDVGLVVIAIENAGPERVRNQLAYLSSIIHDSAQCIIGTDLTGRIISWNKAASAVYGYSAQDVTGRNISIIMPPDISFSLLNRIINGESVSKQRVFAWTKQGLLVNIELSISPIKDDHSKVQGISFISRDISMEILAEKKIFHQARMLEAVNDSILGVDFEGKIIYWNHGSQLMFGWKSEDMLGKPYSMLLVDEDDDELFNNLQQTDTGQWEGVKRVITRDADKKYARMSINTIYDENAKPNFLVIVFTDISEIIEARIKAEEAVRFKTDFINHISHEIRTPMSSVIGYTELMKEDKLDRKDRKYLQGIKQSAGQLLDLINDFLDLSKIEANSMLLDEVSFDIEELIYSGLKVFEPTIRKKRLDISIDIDNNVPARLWGDKVRIRQVYNNLLSNAVKFTPAGGIKVEVRLVSPVSDHSQAILSIGIIDSGIGIPVDQMGDIFTPFTQVNGSSNAEYGGTGLGLTISKRLIELMQGSISVESNPGQGSRFEFTLTLKYPDTQDTTLDLRNKDIMSRRILLLVSEQEDVIDQFNQYCREADLMLVTINYEKNYHSAVNFYQPRAIIVDLDHNDNKLELLRTLKKLSDIDKTLLLVYSNCMSKEEIHRYGGSVLIAGSYSGLIQVLEDKSPEEQIRTEIPPNYPLVLVFDKDSINLKLLSTALQNSGLYTCSACEHLDATHYLDNNQIGILLIDMDMVDMNPDWLHQVVNQYPHLALIGLRKNDFQYHPSINTYVKQPYSTQALLAAIDNALILNHIGSDDIDA